MSRLILVLFIGLLLGCNEIPPQLGRPINPDTNAERKVLVEEYTGVRCGNCPAGTALLQKLKEDFGDQLVVVSFHAGFFAKPYPSSTQDFKTDETEALQTLLGEPLGYPAATINRKTFDSESRILNSSDWAFRIEQELQLSSNFNIENELNYDDPNDQLNITTRITQLQDVQQNLFLTIYLVEDRIINAQATPDIIEEDYLHRHILRKILTPLNGQPIFVSSNRNEESYNYQLTLDPIWKFNDLSVVSFVHLNGELLDVLQVEESVVSQ